MYSAELYDTLTGMVESLPCGYENGKTIITRKIYEYDSLLIRYTPAAEAETDTDNMNKSLPVQKSAEKIPIADRVPVTLCEPNVLLLDMGEYALDGEPFHPIEELLIADNLCRQKLGWPCRKSAVAQPWTMEKEKTTHKLTLRFSFDSEIEVTGAQLALEDADAAGIRLNGEPVPSEVTGWYVDHAIQTVSLPKLKKGTNQLEISIPFGRRTNVEWCYILGDFGVRVSGREKVVTAPVRTLTFGDIVPQGLPFYGGNLIYHIDLDTGSGRLTAEATHFRGALLSAALDGKEMGKIFIPPYRCEGPEIAEGHHTLDITVFGNRYNTFGQVHLSDSACRIFGPDSWRTTGSRWSYEYQLKPTGLLSAPNIVLK